MFRFCSHIDMEHDSLADMILTAPAWARIGLTMRDETMRERAARAMAQSILERMGSPPEADRDQLPLPL